MLNYELLRDDGILVLSPDGALEASDFEAVAAVSDSAFLSSAPQVASHFLNADVGHSEFAEREAAIYWLHEG